MVFAIGIVHPRPRPQVPGDPLGFYISEEEMGCFMKDFIGKDVLVEHIEGTRIGHVTGMSRGKNGNILAHLYIDEKKTGGAAAFKRMRQGTLLGLSIKYDAGVLERILVRDGVEVRTKVRLTIPIPIEISLVVKNAIQQARILVYGLEGDKLFWSRSGNLIQDHGEQIGADLAFALSLQAEDSPVWAEFKATKEVQKNTLFEICQRSKALTCGSQIIENMAGLSESSKVETGTTNSALIDSKTLGEIGNSGELSQMEIDRITNVTLKFNPEMREAMELKVQAQKVENETHAKHLKTIVEFLHANPEKYSTFENFFERIQEENTNPATRKQSMMMATVAANNISSFIELQSQYKAETALRSSEEKSKLQVPAENTLEAETARFQASKADEDFLSSVSQIFATKRVEEDNPVKKTRYTNM